MGWSRSGRDAPSDDQDILRPRAFPFSRARSKDVRRRAFSNSASRPRRGGENKGTCRSLCERLHDPPFWTARARIVLPQTFTAEKGIAVVAQFDLVREVIELFRVASAEHNIIGQDRLF